MSQLVWRTKRSTKSRWERCSFLVEETAGAKAMCLRNQKNTSMVRVFWVKREWPVCWELLWLYTPDNFLGVTFPRRLESRHVRQLTFHKYNIGSNVCLPYCILVISLVKEKNINPLLGGCVKQATQNNASGEAAHILSTSSTLSSSSSVSCHTTPERSVSSAPLASFPHHIPSLAYTWQRHPCDTPYLASVDWTGADANHLPRPIRFWHLEICNGDRGWIGQSVLEAGIVRSWRGRARAMGKWTMIKNKM